MMFFVTRCDRPSAFFFRILLPIRLKLPSSIVALRFRSWLSGLARKEAR